MAEPAAGTVVREHLLLLRALARAQRLCTEQRARLARAEAELVRARAAAIVRTTEAQWARERLPDALGMPPRRSRIRAWIGDRHAVPWP